jgi:sphinganine-1-phosphate aldolase
MVNIVARAEGTLRGAVNALLAGADPYSTLKMALTLLGLSRLLRALKRAMRCEGLYAWFLSLVMPLVLKLPVVQAQLRKETEKLRESIEPGILKDVTEPCARLPVKGESEATVLQLMQTRQELDTKYWSDGRVTGAIYHGGREYMDFIGKVYGMFAFTNPLHASIHPSTRQMESEVLSMVTRMYNGDSSCCGAFTTGGTESILMAMKAYRDWGKAKKGISRPNIVVCVTAHAAFDKAGQYFGLEVRKARTAQGSTNEVDVFHVRRLVDSNTVAIVGSAPQYAHGTIDPIPELSELALARGIGLHVDCCLGGFLLPFMEKAGFRPTHLYDFRLPGVTTISCDPHKCAGRGRFWTRA